MSYLQVLHFAASRLALGVADRTVTHPLFSWTWAGSSDTRYAARLTDFRPSDSHTVHEMMDGKYLLAGEKIDTGGVSPFAVDIESDQWFADLHSFAWLRHFSLTSDPGERAFARTLVIDWVARYGRFDRDSWDLFIMARRVLNWLKSLALLTADASPEQVRSLNRTLGVQLHALKVRAPLCTDPLGRLMAAIAQVGAALSEVEDSRDLAGLVEALDELVVAQTDDDGLLLNRNPHTQLQLLIELIPVHQALAARHGQLASGLSRSIEAMHRAFSRLVMSTREPAYFNGCGQLPVELVLAVGSQSGTRPPGSGLCGGYGILVDGPGKLVADGGSVPALEYSSNAHASALAFEFACGPTLLAGNCGPAPGQLAESGDLFRHSSAHSAPTIDDLSSGRIDKSGLAAGLLRKRGSISDIVYLADENTLEMRTEAYAQRYGLTIQRRLTLMGGGQTLVGQDRFEAASSKRRQQGSFTTRFHLAPGVALERSGGEDLIRLVYRNGEVWAFLWEGAKAEIEDSVRHSAYLGLNRTRQIVLHGPAFDGAEIAWVFTRQS